MKNKIAINYVANEIYEKRKEVRYDIRDLTVEAISNKYSQSLLNKKTYNYIYIPEYQRDFTWDENRQSKLIESIILGLPIPFIFVAENKNSSWEIVDGSQRIRTIYQFINNKLVLKNLEAIKSLNGYKFSELDLSRQGKILNTALRIIVLSEETTDDIKKDMFERINRGSDLLKPMEKRKGIYAGKFTDFIYEYCKNNKNFADLVPVDKWLEKRQEKEELLLRFFALSDKDDYTKGIDVGIAKFLDKYLENKNKEWSVLNDEDVQKEKNEYIKKISGVIKYVSIHFPFGFRYNNHPQTKRSVFEAISVGVWRSIFEQNINNNLSKETVEHSLQTQEFKKFNTVNELHKKNKLTGRINYIYELVKMKEE